MKDVKKSQLYTIEDLYKLWKSKNKATLHGGFEWRLNVVLKETAKSFPVFIAWN